MSYTKEELDEIERLVTELDDEDRESELFNPTFKSSTEEDTSNEGTTEDANNNIITDDANDDDEDSAADDDGVVVVDAIDDVVSDNSSTSTIVEESTDSNVIDNNKNEVDSTNTDDTYITIKDDDTRKLKLKYKGEEVDISATEIVKFSQIGIDAQNKNYKEAVQTAKVVNNLGLSTSDLENLAKLKSGDPSALRNIIANSNIKLDDLRTDIFEYEEEDLDTIRSVSKPSIPSEISRFIESSPQSVHDTYNRLENTFPGLSQYQDRLISQNDVANYEAFLYNLGNGAFEKVSTKAQIEFASLTDSERSRIISDTGYFNGFVNSLFNSVTQDKANAIDGTNVGNTNTSVATPANSYNSGSTNTKPVTVDTSKKDAYGKPKGTPPIVDNKRRTEKTAEQLTEEYMKMDTREFTNMVRSR